MDPLSIAGSIAGLVSLADLVFRTTATYIKCVREARKEVEDLLEEVKQFSLLLHNLSLVTSGLEITAAPVASPSSDFRSTFILDCQQVLGRIKYNLEKAKHDFENPSTLSRVHHRLKWPLSTTDTKDIIQTLQRYRQIINVALSADSLSHLKVCLSRQEDASKRIIDVQTTANKILDIVTKVKLDQTRQKILDFFSKNTNPRSDFETSKNLRHPQTGLWFTESDDFKEWKDTPGSRIWISGIPGAGKSVLAGLIITECLQLSSLSDKSCSAYFFCTYRDKKTQLSKNILSSLASQIARQNEQAFKILEGYYDDLKLDNDLPADPSANKLLEILSKMAACFDQVFIVVDGLDECETDDDDVAQILARLAALQGDSSITTALLSRDVIHIREQLEVDFTHIDVEAHTDDIQLYVACEIEKLISEKKLRIRNLSLKDQIMTQLVTGAKGMFRWVACQLDHICDLPTDKARREALSKLPPTLPATYERILHKVERSNEHVRKLVQKSLQLISLSYFDHERLNIRQICEAVSVPDTIGDSLEDDEVIDEYEIIKWCGSLIRKTADGQAFDFAHVSVQEFLTGTCRTHTTLKSYHISEGGAQSLLGPLCLRYLLLSNHARSPLEAKDEIEYILEGNDIRKFYEYATIWWPKYIQGRLEDKDISQLIRMLFNKTTNFTSWVLEFVRHCLSNCSEQFYREQTGFGPNEDVAFTVISAIKRPDFTPLHMASVLGLSSLCRNLLEDGAKLNLESRFGTPLHCAVGGLSVFSDSDPIPDYLNTEGNQRDILLPSASYDTVQLLLDAGATVSLQFVTPFQQMTLLSLSVLTSATYGHGFRVAAELIRAGAVVEDEDAKSISSEYKNAMSVLTPKEFKSNQRSSDAIIYILKVTSTPKNDNSPRSRLHSSTCTFAQVMELELDGSIFYPFFDDSARYESLYDLLEDAIEYNDVDTVESCINRTQPDFVKTINFKGKEEGFLEENWTALHLACYEESRDVLNLLLKAGCDFETATEKGRTPIQLCRYNEDVETLKILLDHGASSIKQDQNLNTIWHMAAASNSIGLLKQLTALDPDRDCALCLVSSKGRTPICEALSERNEEVVLVLLQYCPTVEFWKSDKPLFRQAAQLGSLDVVQKLLNTNAVLDKLDAAAGSPLHYIAPNATVACVRALVDIFPHCRMRRNGRTPFQLLLARAVDDDAEVDPETFKVLLSNAEICTPEEVNDTWEFFCSMIVPYATKRGYKRIHPGEWLPQLLSHLFDIGLVMRYQCDKKQSALVPFADALNSVVTKHLPRVADLLRGHWRHDREEPLVLDNWEWLSQVVFDITGKMEHWDITTTQPSAAQLLAFAILNDDGGMMQLLLDKGVNPHQKIDKMSALELACIPEVSISEANFHLLLSYAKVTKLNAHNEDVQGLSIVDFTAVHGFQDRGLWKLKQVLAAGAKCNIISTNIAHEPALSYHVRLNSHLTAEALLEFGADPWETDSFGYNATAQAVINGNTYLLAKITAISAERRLTTRWDQTRKGYLENLFFSSFNYLHLAAFAGQVASLKFFLKGNLFSDLEVLDDNLQTPLHYAAYAGQLPVVKFLKERGCNLNSAARDGATPLHLAVQFGHVSVVKALLRMGAKSKVCGLGLTPLSHAYNGSNLDIINILKSLEGHISWTSLTSSKGLEVMAVAFCNAMKRNDIQTCKDIHRQGFPLDYQLISPWPVTPLMFAVCNLCHPSIVEWLIKRRSKVSIVFQGPQFPPYITVLEAAIATPMYNGLLPLLLTKYFQEGGSFLRLPRTPLNTAVTSRNHEGLTILLDKLIYQEERGHSSTGHQCKYPSNPKDSPNSILHSTINHRNKFRNEETALHCAAAIDDVNIAELLIDKGADTKLGDSGDFTALHRTASHGSIMVAKLLLDRGADLEPLSENLDTPLMEACCYGQLNMVKLLLKHGDPSVLCNLYGANLLTITLKGEGSYISRLKIWNILLHRDISIHQADIYGECPVHHMLASHHSYLKIFLRKSLSALGILDVEWPSSWLVAWVSKRKSRLDCIMKCYRLIRRFLGREQPLRWPASITTGRTSIFYLAASRGHITAIEDFLAIGVDLELECCEEGTALMIASTNGQLDAVKYLVRKEAKLCYFSHGSGRHKSAFGAASTQGHEEVLHWLLMGRHVEQPKIEHNALDDPGQAGTQTGKWSGIQQVRLPLKWEWRQRREESMFEYALRRQEVISEFRGEVIEPKDQSVEDSDSDSE